MNPDLHKQCIDTHLHAYIHNIDTHTHTHTHTHTMENTNKTTEAIAPCVILANKNYFYSRDAH